KEIRIALMNGVLLGLVVGVVTLAWFGNPGIALVIFAAMVINLGFAATAGVLVPMALRRFNVDPAVGGGVILTTVTDVMGFLAFLGLATLFLLR
ncbi:MAG: magnesium transporter, partial [Lysobacteraceae bacterium]